MSEVSVTRLGPERIGELEPLWKALHFHHTDVAPQLAGRPPRPADEAWDLRRRTYEEWLSQPDPFCLVASLDGLPVGYAMVTFGAGLRSWTVGNRIADLQTLSVLPHARGAGVGERLMEAVENELRGRGIREVRLLVLSGNDAAVRFYERRGFATISQVMVAPIEPPA